MQVVAHDLIAPIVGGYVTDPFAVLGPHMTRDGLVVRVFRPGAQKIEVVTADGRYSAEQLDPAGFFEATLPDANLPISYTLAVTFSETNQFTEHDPYNFAPVLTEFDLHLLGEGTIWRAYEKMGAHLTTINGVEGVHFAVWAPNAQRVSVVGNFVGWDTRVRPMRLHPSQGIWEIFLPGLAVGEVYKYAILSRVQGYQVEKSDPYGFAAEVRPSTASIVTDLSTYEWQDSEWMKTRAAKNSTKAPISIYECHLGGWRRHWHDNSWLGYRELADQLISYVKEHGYTHIELLPVAEHPFDGSWGYQVTGYYAATSRYGSPQDLMYLIDQAHQNSIGVLVDWVPAHFPKDEVGLNYFDGTHLFEHADPRQGEHPDWGTLVFNFGRNEVRNFLLSNAIFWLDKYHVDGLRVDAVASMLYLDYSRKAGEWVPNKYGGRENLEAIEFLKQFNTLVHQEYPDTLTAAEESTAWPMVTKPAYVGGLGFDFKWNMGWMHDILEYVEQNPIYRRYHHDALTFSMMYAFTEQFILPISHDEVVHGKGSLINKMPGDDWQKMANVRAFLGYMWTHPGKKLLFMGSEFGMWREWNEDRALDWDLLAFEPHRKLLQWVTDLNSLYRREKSLYEVDDNWQGFEWLTFRDNENSVVGYMRKAANQSNALAVLCNFTPVPREGYRVGVPVEGWYTELLNSDAEAYGGGNMGNGGGVHSEPIPFGEFQHSISVMIPPLGVVILRVPGESSDEADAGATPTDTTSHPARQEQVSPAALG